MADPLRLVVRTPSRTVLEVEAADWVHVELAEGKALTIWPGHLPMLGETVSAPLSYADEEGEHEVELPPGLVQMQDRTVTLFLAGMEGDQMAEATEGVERFERLSETLLAARGAEEQDQETG